MNKKLYLVEIFYKCTVTGYSGEITKSAKLHVGCNSFSEIENTIVNNMSLIVDDGVKNFKDARIITVNEVGQVLIKEDNEENNISVIAN